MLGIHDLKPKISITPATGECPVKGCCRSVERQRRSFRREERFQCPDHKIYISPSTFEYAREGDNLLWHNRVDLDLLEAAKTVKRESRIARDNSEDACCIIKYGGPRGHRSSAGRYVVIASGN